MGEALKPCPFCGTAKNQIDGIRVQQNGPKSNRWWECVCDVCDFCGPALDTKEQAIAAWNQRAPQQVTPLDFEHLRQWGFAPGSYLCFCSDCGKQHNADKCAWRCLECAEKKALDQRPVTVAEAADMLPKCCICNRIVDPREPEDGGDIFGCELDETRWVCDSDCYSRALAEGEAPNETD